MRPAAVLGSAHCLRKSLISGMTKDGSASRLSNHAPVSSLLTSLLPLASSRGPARFARPASLRERSEALQYGARLVVREAHLERLHEQADSEARGDVEERLDRKRVS